MSGNQVAADQQCAAAFQLLPFAISLTMDRVSKLTEQLRIRQPHLSEDDFLTLEDYNGVNGHLGPPIMNEEEEDLEPEPEPLGDLKVERRNEPPKDGFSNENVELLGNEIGK